MKNSTTMRLSYWAKSHRVSAILVIAISKIVIGSIALFLGISANFEGLTMESKIGGLVFGIIAAVCIVAYPTKRLKKKLGFTSFYQYRKVMDGFLVAFGFAFCFFVGNLLPNWVAQPTTLTAMSPRVPTALSIVGQPKTTQQAPSMERGGMFHKWLIKKAKSKIKRAMEKIARLEGNTMEVPMKIFLTLVFLALIIGLGYLTLSLGCNLSCSGQETLGAIVGIGGTVLVVTLGILAIIKIWQKDITTQKAPIN